jgi:hypothetical protein
MLSSCYLCLLLTGLEFSWPVLLHSSTTFIKLRENPSCGSWGVPWQSMGEWTDETKLTIAFHNFGNALKTNLLLPYNELVVTSRSFIIKRTYMSCMFLWKGMSENVWLIDKRLFIHLQISLKLYTSYNIEWEGAVIISDESTGIWKVNGLRLKTQPNSLSG